MIEPIDRNEAIRRFDHIRELTADQVVDMLKRVPTCRHKGKWLNKEGVYGAVYCSECDYELRWNDTNFCPNCGSDNRGENELILQGTEMSLSKPYKGGEDE